MATKVLTAHVTDSLATKIDQMAARLDRSRAWVLKQALEAWIELEEEHYQLTLAAMTDVETGHVIDHQSVRAWADSLNTDKPLPLPQR